MRTSSKQITARAAAAVSALMLCAASSVHAQPIIVTNLSVPNGLGGISVNPALNRLYLSGQGAQPMQIDGAIFIQNPVGAGASDGLDVDLANNNFWLAALYSGTATVWNSNDTQLTTISLADCPTGVNVDSAHRRAWVSAQCGANNDPIWAVDADTYAVVAGPIGSGGVQGSTIVNPATGRFYLAPSSGSERISPPTYALTANTFGTVLGVNTTANLLYAVNGNTLQIINGAPDPEVILTNVTVPSGFGGTIGVNPVLNRIYIGGGSNVIAVLDALSGQSIETISLGTGITSVGNIVVDASRSRVYAMANAGSSPHLFVIEDAPLVATVVMANDPNLKAPLWLSTPDGQNLFVSGSVSSTNRAIFRVPTAGGSANRVVSAADPYENALIGPNLFWIDPNAGPITDTEILKASTNGGGSGTPIYVGSQVGQPILDGSGLTTDGAILYAADEVDGTVFRLNPDGSNLTQIGPARYGGGFGCEHLNTITVAQNTLYIADSGRSACSVPPAVVSIPTNGTSFTTLASGAPLVQPSGIAAGYEQLFVSDPGATNTIWMVPASGGAPTPLISGGPFCHIQGLAFWNGILYVADTCGTIYKVGPTQPAVITSQPVSTTAAPGGTVTLSVSASGYPLSYQWSFNGTNIAGATNATLTLNNLGAANVGHYTVTISNMLGSVASQSVSLSLFGLQMYAGLNISGPIGASYSVQSTPALGSHNWTTRTNITLTSSQYIYIDYSSSTNAQQFYRAVPLP